MQTTDAALAALREHFGFEDFREGQREVVESVLAGHDTVVVMPTGGGKSLCYQLPALMKEGATVVVSPLIALMKDQVDALLARGLPATFVNSSIDFEEQKSRIRRLRRGDFKLVYVAPERFRSNHFTEALRDADVSLFAVDEAHCVSTWGHDFRPDYLRLKHAIEQVGRPQVVALTATATPYVRSDIIEQLGLRSPRAFVSGFDRPNLALRVVHTQKEREKIAHIRALASASGGSGIIYSSTRKSVEQVARRLAEARLSVVAYHAGMEDAERERAQNSFMSGERQMIVATNAFGMGIDKPDIRFVAHYHMPGSIEAYYQEIGRAGRDGLPSTCVLLFNYADKRTQDYFIEGSYPPPELIAKIYEALVATNERRMELSTREIAARAGVRNEMAVQSALIILEKAGHIERGAGGENRASLRLLMPAHLARETVGARRSERDKLVLQTLLGTRDLNQRADTELNVAEFAESVGLDLAAARRSLASLAESGVVSYQPARRTRGVLMLDERPAQRLNVRPQELARRAALEQRKLREMISFCYTDRCYRAFILDYFGDTSHAETCGRCGNCLGEANTPRQSREALAIPPPDAPSRVDRLVRDTTPTGRELEYELDEQSRRKQTLRDAEAAALDMPRASVEEEIASAFASRAGESHVSVTEARELNEAERLCVRKILACAARMEGRFGKGVLAATLRGSRSAKITQAGLDRLTTYGILADMTQDEIMTYADALVAAGALRVTGGAYPTVQLTALGNDVMREREQIKLALPDFAAPPPIVARASSSPAPSSTNARGATATAAAPRVSTVEETYAFYRAGLTIEEICEQRGLTAMTVEKHLAEC
ncbi:MAG: RecQ family ATP-dependent DNA helicase, partial [Acidobacteria bacterium]|nr:RecQ family ATP-dependent DNA helicase [Acidobacteriota bacterium]